MRKCRCANGECGRASAKEVPTILMAKAAEAALDIEGDLQIPDPVESNYATEEEESISKKEEEISNVRGGDC